MVKSKFYVVIHPCIMGHGYKIMDKYPSAGNVHTLKSNIRAVSFKMLRTGSSYLHPLLDQPADILKGVRQSIRTFF